MTRYFCLMILAGKPLGKLPHIPHTASSGRPGGILVACDIPGKKSFPIGKLIRGLALHRRASKVRQKVIDQLNAPQPSQLCFSLLRFFAGMRKLAGWSIRSANNNLNGLLPWGSG